MSVRSSALPQDSACIQLCADMYHPLDGTSMAAPHVTGVVTLMLQKNPSLPIEEIRRHLLDNTTRNPATMGGALPNNNWGHGIINASAAVSAVPAATPLLGPTEPGPANRAEPRLGDSQAPDLGGAIPNISIQRREPSAEWLDRRDKLLQTSLGQKYVDLVRLHIHEARMLIKTNQRVATVWLRNNGPSIMRSLLYILYNPNEPPPNEIGGKSIAESIDRIIAVLKRYGSATLQHDLEQYGTTIHNYLGLSYYQLLARFRSEGAGTAD